MGANLHGSRPERWARALHPCRRMPHLRCETCGNDYDKPFRITKGEKSYVFDSFECAIQALAPACGNCGVRVLGHGVEQGEKIYCCAHCAAAQGADRVRDRA